MIVAAARVAIDLVDQLADRRTAVAQHLGRLAASGRHDPIAHDQQTIVGAGSITFDQHPAGFLAGGVEGGHDLLARGQIRGHAAALAAVLRFDDDRRRRSPGPRPRRLRRRSPGRPSGTGTPIERSSERVSSLS